MTPNGSLGDTAGMPDGGERNGASPPAADLAAAREEGFRPSVDAAFDAVLDPALRALSETHWTPARVARLGARWLWAYGARSVVDVGAGVGKFCILASLEVPLTCVGLEHRERLAVAARAAAVRLGATRCEFAVGGLELLSAYPADALYFYNPFAENISATSIGIDETVELSPRRYLRELQAVKEHLRRAPLGTLLLTYHGFGGRFPAGWRLVRSVEAGGDFLQLHCKEAGLVAGG